MKATFENTLDILVKAYLNDTLTHGDCSACAVGNIVGGSEWNTFFMTEISSNTSMKQKWNVSPCNISDLELRERRAKGSELISRSGYSKKELARVEWAFETAPRNCNVTDTKNDEWMFNGLMAVVDVLADIHGINLEQKESAKLLFVKP